MSARSRPPGTGGVGVRSTSRKNGLSRAEPSRGQSALTQECPEPAGHACRESPTSSTTALRAPRNACGRGERAEGVEPPRVGVGPHAQQKKGRVRRCGLLSVHYTLVLEEPPSSGQPQTRQTVTAGSNAQHGVCEVRRVITSARRSRALLASFSWVRRSTMARSRSRPLAMGHGSTRSRGDMRFDERWRSVTMASSMAVAAAVSRWASATWRSDSASADLPADAGATGQVSQGGVVVLFRFEQDRQVEMGAKSSGLRDNYSASNSGRPDSDCRIQQRQRVQAVTPGRSGRGRRPASVLSRHLQIAGAALRDAHHDSGLAESP